MRLGLGKPDFAYMELHSSLMCTPDVMLPFSWHQGEDPWSNNAATSRAETLHATQVIPPLNDAYLFDIISDETISSAVRIAVSNETAFQTR